MSLFQHADNYVGKTGNATTIEMLREAIRIDLNAFCEFDPVDINIEIQVEKDGALHVNILPKNKFGELYLERLRAEMTIRAALEEGR